MGEGTLPPFYIFGSGLEQDPCKKLTLSFSLVSNLQQHNTGRPGCRQTIV